jgi:flagellar biosynthesis/type III secretory pathway protein FliH
MATFGNYHNLTLDELMREALAVNNELALEIGSRETVVLTDEERERAFNNGYEDGYADGKDEGYDQGYADGKDEGYDQGYADGVADREHDKK